MSWSIIRPGRPRTMGALGLRLIGCTLIAAAVAVPSRDAQAESLVDAMISAYLANPALNAARSGQMATDEEVARARSGWRPSISANAETNFQTVNTSPASTSDGEVYPKSYGFTLTQPIFRGFRTWNSVRQAEATVRAGQQDLKAVEQTTLLNAATTYMNVVRDQAIVRLRRNNVKVLTEQLNATEDRFDVGEVTKTDVAQSRARQAGSVSDLSLAEGNLKSSRAAYEEVIGHPPSRLFKPAGLAHALPNTLTAALEVGLEENPQIIAAVFRTKASRHAVDTVRGELLPEVSLQASYQKSFDTSSFVDDREVTTVTGRVTVPLYQAGEVSARIRQSKHVYHQRQDELQDARNKVRSAVVSAWSQLQAVRAQLKSDQTQVGATQTALTGVKEEERVGQRTVLDVLDAQQELLNSQVSLETTRRDLVVASFNLLSSVGRLTVQDLGLSVENYDPEAHYVEVRRKWFGTGPRLPKTEQFSFRGSVIDY